VRCEREGKQVAQFVEQRGRSFPLGHIDVNQRTDLVREPDVGGEQEDGYSGLGLPHSFGDFAAMHSGHGIVEYHGFNGLGGKEFEASVSVGCGEHLVAGAFEEDFSNTKANHFIVYT
jgi:hypothetical protein